jgi:signal transduction histidine kinase
VREIRQTIFALNQPEDAVPAPGLRARVLREIAVAGSALGFAPRVHVDDVLELAVSAPVADQLVAALREGLANVVRHAHASSVDVAVERRNDDLVLTVTDDGVGVFPGDRRSGLANLEQRARALGGWSSTESMRRDGSGTRLTWQVPLDGVAP